MSEQWLEVTLPVPAGELDRVCDILTANGMAGLVVEEEGEFLRFLEQNRQYWDYVDEDLARHMKGASRVKFYVPDNEEGQRQLRAYLTGLEQYEPQMVSLREEDWANSWKQYYKPLTIGQRLYVVPEWERGGEIPQGRAALYLNPGLTFGTGSHASTQLCLEGVERYVKPGSAVLDLGCGSGILSIAALVLGAGEAVGVDIDPKAVGVAYENAAMNGITRERYLVRAGNVLSDRTLAAELAERKWDLVLANIVADVIIPLSAQVDGLLAQDGVFLCSGIIEPLAEEVRAALEGRGLAIAHRWDKNGWVAFAARRKAEGQ